jgi:hypothetical protein
MAVVSAGREGALDWERLIDIGVGPGLALGAERRMRRGPPPA